MLTPTVNDLGGAGDLAPVPNEVRQDQSRKKEEKAKDEK
jgi:hypothetical protein